MFVSVVFVMYIFIVLCLSHHFAYKPDIETPLLILQHLLMPLRGFFKWMTWI